VEDEAEMINYEEEFLRDQELFQKIKDFE